MNRVRKCWVLLTPPTLCYSKQVITDFLGEKNSNSFLSWTKTAINQFLSSATCDLSVLCNTIKWFLSGLYGCRRFSLSHLCKHEHILGHSQCIYVVWHTFCGSYRPWTSANDGKYNACTYLHSVNHKGVKFTVRVNSKMSWSPCTNISRVV